VETVRLTIDGTTAGTIAAWAKSLRETFETT
jgi:hypothetical protein